MTVKSTNTGEKMLHHSKEQMTHFIKEQIASVIQLNPDLLDDNTSFIKCGISSVQAIMIINKIKKKLQLDLNPIAMFEYKNISELSNYLSSELSSK